MLKRKLFHILKYENLQKLSLFYPIPWHNLPNGLSVQLLFRGWQRAYFPNILHTKWFAHRKHIYAILGYCIRLYGNPNERNNREQMLTQRHKSMVIIAPYQPTLYAPLFPAFPLLFGCRTNNSCTNTTCHSYIVLRTEHALPLDV